MIFDAILLLLQRIIQILLAPLTVLNIGIDLVSSIPVVTEFLQVVAYMIPWSNILPLILLMILILLFKSVVSIITFLMKFIPGLGG